MKRRIVINPLTRISGFMEIDVMLEQNKVDQVKTTGSIFRGFEQMMVGRSPFDAIYLTQRICGICSTAHSVASSLALEDALGVQVTELGRYLRDALHCCEFLQNHIRHTYQYTFPDFVKLPEVSSIFKVNHGDFRLPEKVNEQLVNHYFESLQISRLSHQMLAVIGGKAPHNHGVFVGGLSTPPNVDQIVRMKSILQTVSAFINDKMLPDVYIISKYYDEYFQMGKGPGNLMSFGAFDNYKDLGTQYVDPLVYMNNQIQPFDRNFIKEEIDHAWYEGKSSYQPLETMSTPNMDKKGAYSWVKAPRYNDLGTLYVNPVVYMNNQIHTFDRNLIKEEIDHAWYEGKGSYQPLETMSTPNMDKKGAYSWVKAPRYNDLPFEVGPLARLWLNGEYRRGISAMDRTIARALEAKKIVGILDTLLNQIIPGVSVQQVWNLPEKAVGTGLVDTTRGALGHWVKIEDKKISFYQIITPSAWDFSTKDARGIPGTAEQALLGTVIQNPDQPVEVGRILRSFDPCMSCATHVYLPGKDPMTIQVFG